MPKVALLAAGAVTVALVVAIVAWPREGKSVAETMRAAGCTYRDAAPLPPKNAERNDYHLDVPTLKTVPRWSTFPPSAGSHYRLWEVWGFYRKSVPPAMAVHNAEHGGVILWWGTRVPASTVDELRRFYDEQPVGVLGTPLAGLGDRVALTAWTVNPDLKGDIGFAYAHHDYGTGHVAVCQGFDEKAFAAFRNAYRGKSPQGFPLSGDRPGCGPEKPCS